MDICQDCLNQASPKLKKNLRDFLISEKSIKWCFTSFITTIFAGIIIVIIFGLVNDSESDLGSGILIGIVLLIPIALIRNSIMESRKNKIKYKIIKELSPLY